VILVRFLERRRSVDLLVDDADAVARDSDHALDEGLLDVHRVAEDDDVAPLDRLIGQQVLADRPAGA
jgi:hypothetical protein